MPLAKYTNEVVKLAFELKNLDEIALLGESITSIISITFTPSGLTLNGPGPAAIVGTQVQVWVGGGTSGQTYTGVCLVGTSGGKTLESRMPLTMLD